MGKSKLRYLIPKGRNAKGKKAAERKITAKFEKFIKTSPRLMVNVNAPMIMLTLKEAMITPPRIIMARNMFPILTGKKIAKIPSTSKDWTVLINALPIEPIIMTVFMFSGAM